MRVLMTSFAQPTHFHGLVPLAGALRASGHEVRVASHPGSVDMITGAGLTAVPVGKDHRMSEAVAEGGTELQRFTTNIDLSRPEVSGWDYLFGLYKVAVPYFYSVINDDLFVRELVEYARQWQPDMVLWEQCTYAGAVAARASGAAHARVVSGSDLDGHFRLTFLERLGERPAGQRPDPLGEWLARTAEQHGVPYDEELTVGQWTVDTLPERFRLDLPLPVVPMRYVPYNGPAVVPDWLKAPGSGTRVCMTAGFSGASLPIDPATFHHYIDVMAEVDAEIVVTADAARLYEVGPLPKNVRVVDFVPMNVLLESCSAVIHHGGNGTWSTALYHGVPQIVLPYVWDSVLRAQQVAAEGAGLHLTAGEVSAEKLRDSVARIIAEPSFHDNARRLRNEARALSSPQDVVPILEDISRRNRRSVANAV